jgi:hypothetical protein
MLPDSVSWFAHDIAKDAILEIGMYPAGHQSGRESQVIDIINLFAPNPPGNSRLAD